MGVTIPHAGGISWGDNSSGVSHGVIIFRSISWGDNSSGLSHGVTIPQVVSPIG